MGVVGSRGYLARNRGELAASGRGELSSSRRELAANS